MPLNLEVAVRTPVGPNLFFIYKWNPQVKLIASFDLFRPWKEHHLHLTDNLASCLMQEILRTFFSYTLSLISLTGVESYTLSLIRCEIQNLDFLYRNKILLAISTLFRYIADLKKLRVEYLLVFLILVHREKKSGSATTTGLVNTCEESASQLKKVREVASVIISTCILGDWNILTWSSGQRNRPSQKTERPRQFGLEKDEFHQKWRKWRIFQKIQ